MKRAREPQRVSDLVASEADLVRSLRAVQRGLFRFPIATQAAFTALVAEGKRIVRVTPAQRSLEDVYLELVGDER